MRRFFYCEAGFVERESWIPNCWINVECPTTDDIRYLTSELNIPQSFLNDIEDTDERPRVEYEGDWLLTLLRIPMRNRTGDIPYNTVPIGIITNQDIIVTVCYFETEMIPDFIRYTQRKGRVIRHKYDLIMRLMHSTAVWFLKYLKQINNDVNRAEDALEKSIRNEDLISLMRLQKSLVYFETSIRGDEMMLPKLQNIFKDPMYIDKELLEDVETELKQAQSTVRIHSDILTGTMDAFASIISNNVNTIMKRMTSISIILMVPTLIASFYGMNVTNFIEDWSHGFAFIVLCSISLSALAFFIFRKIKWF